MWRFALCALRFAQERKGDCMNRRDLLKGVVTGVAALALAPAFGFGIGATEDGTPADALAALERKYGGRLGVAILDTETGRRAAYRGEERFLMCSTFKWLAVAAVLARVDAGHEQLDRRLVFDDSVLLEYAPVTRRHVGAPGMTIAALCEAAITLSDNTAANLLLSSMGGPSAVTAFARSVGDSVTRLDRSEPELNVGSRDDVPRHHDSAGDAWDDERRVAGSCTVGTLARATACMAACLHHRHAPASRGAAGGLARG